MHLKNGQQSFVFALFLMLSQYVADYIRRTLDSNTLSKIHVWLLCPWWKHSSTFLFLLHMLLSQTGLAIFDPTSPDQAIFVIAGQMENQLEPVNIMMSPPSYLESVADGRA